jgi:hypothetical protein
VEEERIWDSKKYWRRKEMSKLIAKEYKSFEETKRISDDGTEFWYARELADVLEYV